MQVQVHCPQVQVQVRVKWASPCPTPSPSPLWRNKGRIKGGTKTILCEDIDKANALVNQFSSVFTMEPGDEFTALDNATVHMEMSELVINEVLSIKN